jgi:hypothetical protein
MGGDGLVQLSLQLLCNPRPAEALDHRLPGTLPNGRPKIGIVQ